MARAYPAGARTRTGREPRNGARFAAARRVGVQAGEHEQVLDQPGETGDVS
ncbi:hypothetical protein KGA66_26150 [Actinocrinis puniceicyclus]|uniref:Uncharacterized protein n=1 Tax=Actinocrinis puniceicyclus TaxID=977794 RepID=A0A8J8BH89_9ACTN|nr:hypothetical protein [Actinocrinis puniceicyclus]MBS2966549.1 hypothetical protein [Actinocrinis puniceicyclus]